jgi:hypothetical protein
LTTQISWRCGPSRCRGYVTESSFDTYLWQTVERKAKFINQLMRGRLELLSTGGPAQLLSTGSGLPGALCSPVLLHWVAGSSLLPTSLERTHVMAVPTTARSGDVYDAAPDFAYAVSLLAALEDATGQDEHSTVLPFLGMARAELTDFGQRRPAGYIPVQVGDLRSGLADLERRLTALLETSQVLQHSLRLDSARRLLRRGVAAAECA